MYRRMRRLSSSSSSLESHLPLQAGVRASGPAKSKYFRIRHLQKQQQQQPYSWVNCLLYLAVALYLFYFLGLYVPVHRMAPRPTPLERAYPFAPEEVQITVVVMNYGRPRMLQQSSLLPTLTSHPNVQTIYLCHGQNATKFDYQHPKVQNIDAIANNERYGLALRFLYCKDAPTDWVLIVDDDMELYETTINQLLWEFQHHSSHRIVGKYGRSYNFFKVPHRHGYEYATKLHGTVEVVLTKLLLTERVVCQQFFVHEPLVRDLVTTSHPYWNGEDIFLSLVANHYYGSSRNNLALPELQAWEAPDSLKDDDGLVDINGNMDRHTGSLLDYLPAYWRNLKNAYYRGWFWSHAKQRLQQQAKTGQADNDAG